MNKYQSFIFGKSLDNVKCQSVPIGLDKNAQYVNYLKEDDKLIITQDSDITIIDYVVSINDLEIDAIDKIEVLKEDKWYEIHKNNTIYIELSFAKKASQIKFSFKNNIADDYIIDIEFIEADKEQYYAKKEQDYKDNLLKTADIKVSTGADLVNIYFQPCCDKYEYTEIQLYIPKDFVTVGGPYGPVQKPSTWSMIKKCKVDPEEFYKSINGLANGKYSFILKQYDKENVIILETGYIEFTISKPKTHGIMPRVNKI